MIGYETIHHFLQLGIVLPHHPRDSPLAGDHHLRMRLQTRKHFRPQFRPLTGRHRRREQTSIHHLNQIVLVKFFVRLPDIYETLPILLERGVYILQVFVVRGKRVDPDLFASETLKVRYCSVFLPCSDDLRYVLLNRHGKRYPFLPLWSNHHAIRDDVSEPGVESRLQLVEAHRDKRNFHGQDALTKPLIDKLLEFLQPFVNNTSGGSHVVEEPDWVEDHERTNSTPLDHRVEVIRMVLEVER